LRHAPRAVPGTSGIPENYSQSLIIQPWNDPEVLERTVKRHGHEIAAIITEPLMCNLGATASKEGYLKFLREICDANDILLIFDEVITAFRLGINGAQGYYGVNPDLTTMAKALGGGYPVAAIGGRREIMELVAQHRVSHAGTYNTNPLCMAAVKATIGVLEQPRVYEKLLALGDRLRTGLKKVIHEAGLPAVAQGAGPILQIWFEDSPIVDYRDAMTRGSSATYALFTKAMYKRGVLFNASQMGVWYISTLHSEKDIDFTLDVAREAIQEVKAQL
jgi:glutamate-1-semialdehyde 2,1-aminomutase